MKLFPFYQIKALADCPGDLKDTNVVVTSFMIRPSLICQDMNSFPLFKKSYIRNIDEICRQSLVNDNTMTERKF